MTPRTIAFIALIATAMPTFAQPPAGSAPRTASPAQRGQAPRGDAQTPAPVARTPQAVPVAEPPRPRREGQAVNVKVDVTVTDQRGTAAPLKKTISIVVADSMGGRIRSSAEST